MQSLKNELHSLTRKNVYEVLSEKISYRVQCDYISVKKSCYEHLQIYVWSHIEKVLEGSITIC